MISWIKWFFAWLLSIFRRDKARPLRAVYVEELPDKPDRRPVYALGEGSHRWFVALICPCGCGNVLQMSLLPDARPRWQLIEQRAASRGC